MSELKKAIELLEKVVEMQKRNYGNGINTHLELMSLANEIEVELSMLSDSSVPVAENVKDDWIEKTFQAKISLEDLSLDDDGFLMCDKALSSKDWDKVLAKLFIEWKTYRNQPTDDELKKLGKELLKVQTEMYNPFFRVEAVPVSEIIKAFDAVGIDISEKIDF